MIVFVSYARADNDLVALNEIAALVSPKGDPYIDDIHHHAHIGDRTAIVDNALTSAGAFVAVFSPNYLRTPWTCREFDLARQQGIPMFALLPGGRIMELQPAESSILRLVHSTLADSARTHNATALLTSGSKAISRIVLSVGVVLLAIVGLLLAVGMGPVVGTAVAAGGTGLAIGGRQLWKRRRARKAPISAT